MKTGISMIVCFGMLLGAFGCSQQEKTIAETAEQGEHHDHDHDGKPGGIEAPVAPSPEGEKFVLATEPAEPQQVIEARESTKNEDEVVLVGRIGGSENPWIKGRAIFTLVDESLKSCNQIPGDNCPVPWDYCCETDKIPTSSALVKIVDENGEPVQTDARELLGVRELTQVIVKGKAQRDEAGNLTVLATSVYVKK